MTVPGTVLPLLAGGLVISCGALLVLAGSRKLYLAASGRRAAGSDSAIRRALRVPRARWQRLELAAGAAECVAGSLACGHLLPVADGVALAALGGVFCALLCYARLRRVPGGCGCLGLPGTGGAADRVTWRAIARSGLLLLAGVADATVRWPLAAPGRLTWLGAGTLAGAAVLTATSMPRPAWTPRCRRPLRRPLRRTLRALAGHPVFRSVAESVGPFAPEVGYLRSGCADEFWFSTAGPAGLAVRFVAAYDPGTRAVAVHASVQPAGPPAQQLQPVSARLGAPALRAGRGGSNVSSRRDLA
jgi:hypothetical protein